MANNNGVIITTRGLQLLTKLAASATNLEFSNVKVGTGSPPEGMDPSGLTHLVAYKMDGLLADYGYDNDAMDGYVVMQITNTDITSGFIMTEVGLYAMDPDLGEILYAYVDLSGDPNHIMPAENGHSKTVQMKLHIIIGEVKEITATINPLAQVTREVLAKEMAKKSAIVVIPLGEDIPIPNRKPNSWYLKVTEKQTGVSADGIKVGSNMGLKVIEEA